MVNNTSSAIAATTSTSFKSKLSQFVITKTPASDGLPVPTHGRKTTYVLVPVISPSFHTAPPGKLAAGVKNHPNPRLSPQGGCTAVAGDCAADKTLCKALSALSSIRPML